MTTMTVHESVTLDRVLEMVEEDESEGFCIECGEEACNVEPDAHGYRCESCHKKAVYGAEQLMLEQLYHE